MKVLDAVLLSLVVGLSLFTINLFQSDYPTLSCSEITPDLPVEGIVLHDTRVPHQALHKELPFHILQDKDRIRYTLFWEQGKWPPHTGKIDVDQVSLGVAISPNTPLESLVPLLTRLCREYHLTYDQIRSHEDMDPGVACPGPDWDLERLRNELAQGHRKTR